MAQKSTSSKDAWKKRFLVPLTAFAQLAPLNPSRGIVVGSYGAGTLQLYSWDVPDGALQQVTDRPGGISEVWTDPTGTYAYYLEDEGGDELGHVVRIPLTGGATQDLTPGLLPYTLRGLHVSLSGNCLAINPVNAAGFQIYVLDLGPEDEVSAPRQIYCGEWETWECFPSYGGEYVACQSTARAHGARRYTTLVLDTAGGELVGELNDGPESSIVPWSFAPRAGDFRLIATSTRHGFRQPLLWNPLTGKRFDLPFDGMRGDLIPLDWSLDGKQLLLLHSYRAQEQLYRYDLQEARLVRLDHPPGCFVPLVTSNEGVAHFAPGGEILALWQDATHPPEVIALDGTTGKRLRTVLAGAAAPPGRPWQSISFASSDGELIQGWLGVPDGPGPFPAILEVHGGPHGVEPNYFYPKAQSWLANGFAYFSINYRGSTTFGREYMEKIWGNVGYWELEDMVAARNWLVEQGIARPEAILLYGESYGGFLTLWGLGKRPDLWAGGIGVVAGADWVAGYEDSSDALKGAIRCWFGGTPEEKPAEYAASSPITYADQVRAPVLVFHGRNDTRSPAREMELYEARMKALGKEIEVIWFDSGHISEGPEQDLAFMERMIEFACRIAFP